LDLQKVVDELCKPKRVILILIYNPQVLQKQCENIAIFSARRLRVALGIIFTLATFLIDERIVPPDYASLSVLLTLFLASPPYFLRYCTNARIAAQSRRCLIA
jgi:hypothetical protein